MARRKKGEPLTEWAKRNPKIVVAAVNLRTSGVSEKAIFKNYEKLLKDNPSYRQLRAALREKGIRTRADATQKRRAREYLKSDGTTYTADASPHGSRYLDRRSDRIANPRPEDRAKLESNTVLGRTLAVQDDSDAYADESVVEFLDSDYEGYPA